MKDRIPGGNGKKQTIVIPPVNVMIEQIWRSSPIMQSILYRVASTTSVMNELMQSNLEMELLIREFAEKSGIKLSTPEELRKKIATDRRDWLAQVLNEEAGKMEPEQEDQIKKELEELNKYIAEPDPSADKE